MAAPIVAPEEIFTPNGLRRTITLPIDLQFFIIDQTSSYAQARPYSRLVREACKMAASVMRECGRDEERPDLAGG
jgi:hypothetical protein